MPGQGRKPHQSKTTSINTPPHLLSTAAIGSWAGGLAILVGLRLLNKFHKHLLTPPVNLSFFQDASPSFYRFALSRDGALAQHRPFWEEDSSLAEAQKDKPARRLKRMAKSADSRKLTKEGFWPTSFHCEGGQGLGLVGQGPLAPPPRLPGST